MWIIIALLAAAVLVLAVRLIVMRRSVREIRTQLREKRTGDTNTRILVTTGDAELRQLAASLNDELKEIRRQKLRYEQGDAGLKTAVANISHDLRTPLTAIRGYIDLLAREELPEQAERYLAIVSERTNAMRSLTEELLQYSVAVSEAPEPERTEVRLNAVLEMSIAGFYAVLKERGITPQITICETPVVRHLHEGALSRIFSNLISNAVRYSDGDLAVSLTEDGTVTFSNTASSLDAVTAGRLFDRFYTVENAGRSTGLGLSIARALTEEMGGEIGAELLGQTLCIRLHFPQ